MPKKKTTPQERIAQLVRHLGTTERGERANAWRALESAMGSEHVSWNDIANWVERGAADHLYSETEMQEYADASRAEGVEAGVQIGLARAHGGSGNGHLSLPKPSEMAEFCADRAGLLKDDKQREFVADMVLMTRRGVRLSLGRLGYLASIYIQIGGRI